MTTCLRGAPGQQTRTNAHDSDLTHLGLGVCAQQIGLPPKVEIRDSWPTSGWFLHSSVVDPNFVLKILHTQMKCASQLCCLSAKLALEQRRRCTFWAQWQMVCPTLRLQTVAHPNLQLCPSPPKVTARWACLTTSLKSRGLERVMFCMSRCCQRDSNSYLSNAESCKTKI